MKTVSAAWSALTPICSAAMAFCASVTAVAGSMAVPPVPPVLPPDGVAVADGEPEPDGVPLDLCDELVPVVARDADVVAALVVLLEEVDEAYVSWSVWYVDIADLYAASAARTALYNGVLLIEASDWPAVTVSPALTFTAVTVPLVGKLTLDCVTWCTVPERASTCVTVPAPAVTVR
jgi:hypothetical protein